MEIYVAERFIDGKTVEVIKRETEEEYMEVAACGSRILFDYDGYRFIDTVCPDDKDHYLIIDFNQEDQIYFEVGLRVFYDLVALYNSSNTDVLSQELEAILS